MSTKYMSTYTNIVLKCIFKREVTFQEGYLIVREKFLCQFSLLKPTYSKQTTTLVPTRQKLAGCRIANESSWVFHCASSARWKLGQLELNDELEILGSSLEMSTWARAQLAKARLPMDFDAGVSFGLGHLLGFFEFICLKFLMKD